jgi:hypothetical protein
MTAELAVAICFGTGLTDPVKKKEEYPPGTKSLEYTLMRNAMYVGYAFIDVNHPDPLKAAWNIARRYDCNEVWHGSPSRREPTEFVAHRF